MVLAVVLAIPLGTVAAMYPGRLPDRITSALSLVGLSVPLFWLGLILMIVLGLQLGWRRRFRAVRRPLVRSRKRGEQ